MGILDLFRRRRPAIETRAVGSGFTAQVLAAREQWIAGQSGLAELTAVAQACVSLWEGAFASADVEGAAIMDRASMALLGRSLALRGECVFLLADRLIPAADWDLSTRDGRPRAYRLTVPEIGGGRSRTVLAAEVLHFRVAADPAAPWSGLAPLRRARLSASLLHVLETALLEVWQEAPIGSQIVPFPEAPGTDLATLARDFRGRRGRVLLRESVNVTAAGGPGPATDWRPQEATPDLAGVAPVETLREARTAVALAFGVLPALFDRTAQGPLVREAQRHLAQWTLEPLAKLVAEEASAKLGQPVRVDVVRPLQAYDAGSKARALAALVEAMSMAKERGLTPGEFAWALNRLDLE